MEMKQNAEALQDATLKLNFVVTGTDVQNEPLP
jgi:hypothetical protein